MPDTAADLLTWFRNLLTSASKMPDAALHTSLKEFFGDALGESKGELAMHTPATPGALFSAAITHPEGRKALTHPELMNVLERAGARPALIAVAKQSGLADTLQSPEFAKLLENPQIIGALTGKESILKLALDYPGLARDEGFAGIVMRNLEKVAKQAGLENTLQKSGLREILEHPSWKDLDVSMTPSKPLAVNNVPAITSYVSLAKEGAFAKFIRTEKWVGKKGLAFAAGAAAIGGVAYLASQWGDKSSPIADTTEAHSARRV